MGIPVRSLPVMSLHDYPARPPAQYVPADTVKTLVSALVLSVAPFVALVALSYPTLTAAFLGGLAVAVLYPRVQAGFRRFRDVVAHSQTAQTGLQAVGLRR